MVQVMSSPSADMRSTPRRRAGDDQATFLSRWLKVWVILVTVVVLVVVGYLIVITTSLASINGNLATAQRAVVGAGGNVVTLPNQVDRINGALAGIDPALKPIPGQADEIDRVLADGQLLFVQPLYGWRSDGATLLAIATTTDTAVTAAHTLADALGARGAGSDVTTAIAPVDFRTAAEQLYDRMSDAMRRGDWVAFGHAYDALGTLLNRQRK